MIPWKKITCIAEQLSATTGEPVGVIIDRLIDVMNFETGAEAAEARRMLNDPKLGDDYAVDQGRDFAKHFHEGARPVIFPQRLPWWKRLWWWLMFWWKRLIRWLIFWKRCPYTGQKLECNGILREIIDYNPDTCIATVESDFSQEDIDQVRKLLGKPGNDPTVILYPHDWFTEDQGIKPDGE